jgi:hypothetical protein
MAMHGTGSAIAGGLLIGAVICFPVPLAVAQSAVSVTTKLDLAKCRHAAGTDEEDYGEWKCRGYRGIPIHVSAGDQRVFISFGRNAAAEPAARQTLASFNSEGDAVEWRLAADAIGKRRPFAAIVAWKTTVGENSVRGVVLVVTRLGPGPVCHVGYVDRLANPDAENLAREIADRHARAFRCGVDKPLILGQRGPGFSGPAP